MQKVLITDATGVLGRAGFAAGASDDSEKITGMKAIVFEDFARCAF
jgi:hypothetical protein